MYSAIPSLPTVTKNKSRANPPRGPGSVSKAPKNPDFALKSPVGILRLPSNDFDNFFNAIAFSFKYDGVGAVTSDEMLSSLPPALRLTSHISWAIVKAS